MLTNLHFPYDLCVYIPISCLLSRRFQPGGTFVQPSFRALDLTAIVQYVQYVVKPEEDAAGQYDSLQVDPGVETVEMLLDL